MSLATPTSATRYEEELAKIDVMSEVQAIEMENLQETLAESQRSNGLLLSMLLQHADGSLTDHIGGGNRVQDGFGRKEDAVNTFGILGQPLDGIQLNNLNQPGKQKEQSRQGTIDHDIFFGDDEAKTEEGTDNLNLVLSQWMTVLSKILVRHRPDSTADRLVIRVIYNYVDTPPSQANALVKIQEKRFRMKSGESYFNFLERFLPALALTNLDDAGKFQLLFGNLNEDMKYGAAEQRPQDYRSLRFACNLTARELLFDYAGPNESEVVRAERNEGLKAADLDLASI